jgi:hypothetical protein
VNSWVLSGVSDVVFSITEPDMEIKPDPTNSSRSLSRAPEESMIVSIPT